MAQEMSPDRYCITLADGSCVGGVEAGLSPCMHDIAEQQRVEKWAVEAGYLDADGGVVYSWEEGEVK